MSLRLILKPSDLTFVTGSCSTKIKNTDFSQWFGKWLTESSGVNAIAKNAFYVSTQKYFKDIRSNNEYKNTFSQL